MDNLRRLDAEGCLLNEQTREILKALDSEARLPGFKARLCHVAAEEPWARVLGTAAVHRDYPEDSAGPHKQTRAPMHEIHARSSAPTAAAAASDPTTTALSGRSSGRSSG